MIDEIATGYFILKLILVLHLKKRLTILDGKLCQHRAHPGTHCRALRCGGRRPVRESPSSSAAHSASHDVPSPSPTSPASPLVCVVSQAFDFVHVAAVGWEWKKKGNFLTTYFLCFLTLAKNGKSAESQGVTMKNTTICAVLTLSHHRVDQIGYGINECPDTFVVDLWVNGASRRADGQTPRALLGVHHEEE
jgi:hypothetical protein